MTGALTPQATASTEPHARDVRRVAFGVDHEARQVDAWVLRNARGSEVEILTLGGIIRRIVVPDRDGVHADVVLGFDTVQEYLAQPHYIGALIGRYANRIAGARYSLDGQAHELSRNEPAACLHGGFRGFHAVHWCVDARVVEDGAIATLRYTSPHRDEGFPGALTVRVTYMWRDDDTLFIDFDAETTEPTPLSLTQHSYFNLSGRVGSDVLTHELTLAASSFTPVDADQLPTGEVRDVTGTAFDFRAPRRIGDQLLEADAQLEIGGGYDHNFALDGDAAARDVAARLCDPASGRVMIMRTTAPGLQLYTGNALEHDRSGKQGVPLTRHGGVALEAQAFPDAPNQPQFPSCIVRPGVPYHSRTVWQFTTEPQHAT